MVPLQKFLYVVALLSQFSQNSLDKDATLLISVLNGCVCLSVDCRDSDVEKISEDKNGHGISHEILELKGE